MKLKRPSAYWAELDEKRRSEYRIVAAVLLGIFTLFTAIAVGSYFFTWKQDASLLSEPSLLDSEAAVSNAGSKLGFRWGHFLVTRSFGIAALGLVAFLVAWTVSRALPKLRIPLGKWFVYSFTGTFIGSWLLALVSRLAGWETLFGGGLGGRAAAALVDGSINLVGFVVTAIAILALPGTAETASYNRVYNLCSNPADKPGYNPVSVPERCGKNEADEADNGTGACVTIWEAHPFDDRIDFSAFAPGEVIDIFDGKLIVRTVDGSMRIDRFECSRGIVPGDILY